MTYEISLTPAGRLVLTNDRLIEDGVTGSWIKSVVLAFSSHQASGLFALAAARSNAPLSPSLSYWREFANLYLTGLCKTPESQFSVSEATALEQLKSIEPPAVLQLAKLLSSVPPMRGAEYLNEAMLLRFWSELDAWVRLEVSLSGESLSGWLKKHAPLWHTVGRVCFHLAENKKDPNLPFAFLATYAPGVSRAGRVQYQPLKQALEEYAGEGNKKALINLLSPVHLASERSEFVKELVQSNDIFHPLLWTPTEAYRFLKEVPNLEESGLLVRLPDWWRQRTRPRVAITIGEKKQSQLGLDAMLDFKVELVLGDMKLTKTELQQIMNSQGDGLIYLKGQWVEIDQERLAQALEHWKQVEKGATASGLSFIEGMRLLAGAPSDLNANSPATEEEGQWSFVNAGSWLSEILSRLQNPNQQGPNSEIPSNKRAANLSKNFSGTLRHYQKIGHDWLWLLSSLGLGACLADDMGLGKTVQLLALLLSIKEAGKQPARPSLLVMPASLLPNWQSELKRFAPTLSVRVIHPSQSTTSELSSLGGQSNPNQIFSGTDVVLTTYGMLLRQPWLLDIQWRLVILDEAQAIKNPSASQSRAVKKLKSEARIALTGTPVENRLADLWSLFDFILPGLLGSAPKFKGFINSLDAREHDRYLPLRKLVAPYILRRLKTDKSIIFDLPDKTEVMAFCGLSKEQLALYTRSVDELKEALQKVDGIRRRGLVLSYLLRFKQICNHPSQLLDDGQYDPLKSGKFDRLKTIAEEIASRQEKMLVFTQFREITGPIAAFLSEIFGHSGLVLHGGTPVNKRKNIVDAFQENDGPPFLVLTVKAGGTGLNLTAASHVVHFDRWWNPAVENQATDRAFRIGQHRNVLVHKFVCLGTIEEKIDKMIKEKTALADDILTDGGERLLTELSDRELLNLVTLDLEQVSIGEA